MTKAKRYWLELMTTLEIPREKWLPLWCQIERRYQEKHRYYHRLKHIGHFLDCLYLYEPKPNPALVLAAFYHDFIYDPKSKENEAFSAELAHEALWSLGPKASKYAVAVRLLILATAGHEFQADQIILADGLLSAGEIDLFLDCDLLILAAKPRAYATYVANVRREYGFLPENVFDKGRQEFLENFIARSSIYKTPAIALVAEERAKANLQRELQSLLAQ